MCKVQIVSFYETENKKISKTASKQLILKTVITASI